MPLSRLDRLGRVVRTARHLRPAQLGAQLVHLARGIGAPSSWAGPVPATAATSVSVPFLAAPDHAQLRPGPVVELIGRELDGGDGIDWDHPPGGPLFTYHLHQFDFLRGAVVPPALRLELMLDWIRRHPRGVGWDPHPTCLRVLSWGKLLLTPGALPDDEPARAEIRRSLARQIRTLSQHLEVRLQANHLLSNLIGVVFGGFLLRGSRAERWRSFAGRLEQEIGRQIGADGLHEERSPMYHALLLESLLDLLDLARVPATGAPASLVDMLVTTTSRMLGALSVVCHPDGEIALFSDSAFGIAQEPDHLYAYAEALGVTAARPATPGVLRDAGYARLVAGPFTLIASVAGPAPPHQPGHAHCDALAFELSCGDSRIVTDTGVYEYVPGERRRIARATSSHATIEVDGAEQAEVWEAHRVGGRPDVVLERVEPGVRFVASCRSWSTPDTLHRRAFAVRDGAIEIQDSFEGARRPVRLALPLAPGLEPRLAHDRDGGVEAHVRVPEVGRLRVALPVAAEWRIERRPYYPRFGYEVERACLVGEAARFESGTFRFET